MPPAMQNGQMLELDCTFWYANKWSAMYTVKCTVVFYGRLLETCCQPIYRNHYGQMYLTLQNIPCCPLLILCTAILMKVVLQPRTVENIR